jgi:mono/diheme cytochrome c family protein
MLPFMPRRPTSCPARLGGVAFVALAVGLFVALAAAIVVEGGGAPHDAGRSDAERSDAAVAVHVAHAAHAEQLARGAAVYAFSCTTCHGATGQGFAEARAAFPADHYDCSRCHMPLNPPQMTQRQIESTQSVFSLGEAPPLADANALARFGTAGALHAYIRATMPRWNPGGLDDDAYLDVSAFVLDLAGMLPEGAALDAAALDAVRLVAPAGD